MSSKPSRYQGVERLPRPLRTAVLATLGMAACAGPAQQLEPNNPGSNPTSSSVNANNNCTQIECLQDRGEVREAVATLLDNEKFLLKSTASFALDMIPDNDPRLVDIFRNLHNAHRTNYIKQDVLCENYNPGYHCGHKEREGYLEAIIDKIDQPELIVALVLEFNKSDWCFKRLVGKIPENHSFAVANLYRPNRAVAAAKRITDSKLATELYGKPGIHSDAKNVLAGLVAKNMDPAKAISNFSSEKTDAGLKTAILANHEIPQEIATKVFLTSKDKPFRATLLKTGYVKPEVVQDAFTNKAWSLKVRKALLDKGLVSKETALKAFYGPKLDVGMRKVIFSKGFVEKVAQQDLVYATGAEYLKQLADKAAPATLEAFVQNKKVEAKWRSIALSYTNNQDVIYKLATTGSDMELRIKAILELQDEEQVRKAAKLTLGQVDTSMFAKSLEPKKLKALKTALLKVVGDKVERIMVAE